MRYDTLVLGGGIVGVSIAVHLQERGRSVALVDRRGPGEETSHGNAGLIERCSLFPAAFPRRLSALAAIALKRYPGANFHWSALPKLAPWLLAFRHHSAPERLMATARIMQPMLNTTIAEHRRLAEAAGANSFFRETGWIKIHRSEAAQAAEQAEMALATEFGYTARDMTQDEVLALEPSLKPSFRSGVLWSDPHSVSSPGGVTKAYAAYFERIGGTLLTGDARSLVQEGQGWTVDTEKGRATGREAVVALGPWSMDVLAPLGYRLPLAVKRGYHQHYKADGNAGLSRPILDEEGGYVITPMERGIRLTTGAEFALRDAPKTPVQIAKAEVFARTLFPLGRPVDVEPWMGARPIFPDSRPVIGPAPRHRGLWLAFGHQHLGFTLGPATGRLLAEMIAGDRPFVDPSPFAATRFG